MRKIMKNVPIGKIYFLKHNYYYTNGYNFTTYP